MVHLQIKTLMKALFPKSINAALFGLMCALAGSALAQQSALLLMGGIQPLGDALSFSQSGEIKLKSDQETTPLKPNVDAVVGVAGRTSGTLSRATARAMIILDTLTYAGLRVRIHQTMAPMEPTWAARWTMSAPFMDGQSQQGQRVLIFQGQVPRGPARMQTSAIYELTVEDFCASATQKINFTYDIEVTP